MTILFDPPPQVDKKLLPLNLQGWLRRFYNEMLGVNATGLAWTALNFAASNVTDIAIRHHNDLQNIQGGLPTQYFHLTQAEHDTLTSSGVRNEVHVPFIMLAVPLTL